MKTRKIVCVESYISGLVTPAFVAEVDRIIDRNGRMERYWGPRCEEYEPGCSCCEAWNKYLRNGKVPRATKAFADFCTAQITAAEQR